MLTSINIKNIALITECDISLGKGLNILSGETGAGKSIIIDSLTFVLGDRADKTLIRAGESNAEVQAFFNISLNDKIVEAMTELDIEPEEEVIIKRVMNVEGRNECRINGKVVTLGMLRKLTLLFADIYGQHEHQSLLNVGNHIEILDEYGSLAKDRAKVSKLYHSMISVKNKLSKFGSESEMKRKLDTLRFQIEEIEKADIKENEEEELLATRTKYHGAEKIVSGVNSAYNSLVISDDVTCDSMTSTAESMLSSVVQYDKVLEDLYIRLGSVACEVADITMSLKDYLADFDYDERKADILECRLQEIKMLKRKYGNDLMAYLDKISEEYDMLNNSSELIAELNIEYDKARNSLVSECKKINELRVKASKALSDDIIHELNDLGMKGTTFVVDISSNEEYISEIGYDRIEFLISPNVGQPLKPLGKIISGGEMSRFMLAIKNITARLDKIDCMVFDEIDSGISGNIAQVVAEKLCNISRDRQVIAVTHLPQLASMADNHYLIVKSTKENKTLTNLTILDGDSRVSEIARLIGGSDYSGFAIPHASEMLVFSDNYKKTI